MVLNYILVGCPCCRGRTGGSFQRKQLRKEKKALKTFLYCDRFDCRYATTLWKNVFRSKVVSRKLKSLRPPPLKGSLTPALIIVKPPPCATTSYHPPPIQNLKISKLHSSVWVRSVSSLVFLPQPMVFTYGVNLTLNRVNTSISIQQKPEVHIY